jgi:hypothetical protein
MDREACVCIVVVIYAVLMKKMAILCITTCMMMLQKYQFEHKYCSYISCHKDVKISLAKMYKSFKFTVATGRWHLSTIATVNVM